MPRLLERRLQEKLIVATAGEFRLLQYQIERNAMLKRQLTTSLDDLPQYRYLYDLGYVGLYSLLSLLKFISTEGKYKLYFSKAGVAFTGFVAYAEKGKTIFGVKIASFYDDKVKANGTIAGDLRQFISSSMLTHDKIEWEASRDNPANDIYMKVAPRWFPQYKFSRVWDQSKSRFVYTVYK
jgi:hypothetical protein